MILHRVSDVPNGSMILSLLCVLACAQESYAASYGSADQVQPNQNPLATTAAPSSPVPIPATPSPAPPASAVPTGPTAAVTATKAPPTSSTAPTTSVPPETNAQYEKDVLKDNGFQNLLQMFGGETPGTVEPVPGYRKRHSHKKTQTSTQR
jgi:hypothetical protein